MVSPASSSTLATANVGPSSKSSNGSTATNAQLCYSDIVLYSTQTMAQMNTDVSQEPIIKHANKCNTNLKHYLPRGHIKVYIIYQLCRSKHVTIDNQQLHNSNCVKQEEIPRVSSTLKVDRGVSPSSLALASDVISAADAPSLKNDELAAVCVP
jgi:hypothetical protein